MTFKEELTEAAASFPESEIPIPPPFKLACHFCYKGTEEVKMLIAGPSTFICDACVILSVRILREKGFIV